MHNPSDYRSLTALLQTQSLVNKRVFLRADLNVPLANGAIESDYRLTALLPTLDLLIQAHATVIIATHIGRPKEHEETLSTRQLIPWFAQRGYTVTFAADPEHAYALSLASKPPIIMLENLRFFAGEKTQDPMFAQQLARCADYYVTDSFATLHRTDTSIAHLPYLFAPDHRCIGLLVMQELTHLYALAQHKRPRVLVLGGGKAADKIALLLPLLDTVDTILLCPALVFSFLYARGLPTGASLVDQQTASLCLTILEKARTKQVNVLFPADYYVAYDTFTATMKPEPVPADALQPRMVGITIGPDTTALYAAPLASAGTIIVNGLMGDINRPETLVSSFALFKIIAANTSALRIIGGGETRAAVEQIGLEGSVGYMSTGGGSMLALLGNQTLPGLQPFILKNGTKT